MFSSSLYLSYKRFRAGISSIQGGHHVAHILIKTTFPLSSLNSTTFLSPSTNEALIGLNGCSSFISVLSSVETSVFLDNSEVSSCSEDSLFSARSEEHTSELQSRFDLVCRL